MLVNDPYLDEPKSQTAAARARAEGAVTAVDVSVQLLAQTGLRRRLHHQARLVAVFCRRNTADHIHAVDGAERNLIGELTALLIGNGLAVHAELHILVLALRMDDAIGILGNARRGQRQQRAYGSVGVLVGNLPDRACVQVGVRGRCVGNDIFRPRSHIHRGCDAGNASCGFSTTGTALRKSTSAVVEAKPGAVIAT